MKQVDTYLKRLAFWLPTRRRARIISEIESAVLDRIDARAVANGPLSDAGIEEELRDFGNPVMVAARYLNGRPVISGMLAFFYWRVLVIALFGVCTIQALIAAVDLIAGDALEVGYWPDALDRIVFGLLLAFTCVTLCFFAIQHWGRSDKTQ